MSYDPIAPTEKERSVAYHRLWVGLIANAFLAIGYFVPLPYMVTFACFPVGLGIVIVDVSGRYDDYLYSLRNEGLRWA